MTPRSLQDQRLSGLGQGGELLLTQLTVTALFLLKLWSQRLSGTYFPVLALSISLGGRVQ